MTPVAPGNGDDRPRIAADDGFERNFDREVEVRGDERLAPFDDGPTKTVFVAVLPGAQRGDF